MSEHATAQHKSQALAAPLPTPGIKGPRDSALTTLGVALNATAPVQRVAAMAPNRTGLPDGLKSGMESMARMSLDHVRVHRNSSKPAQLNAHAYAQGSDIHLAPGQERHLPHEAWHVVQQAQGRVKPTMQMAGVAVNDDRGLEAEADMMGAQAIAQRAVLEEENPYQLHTAAATQPSSMKGVVQRAGVKSELASGQKDFDEFITDTNIIKDTRTEISNSIYNTYKPPAMAGRTHFTDKVAHVGPNAMYDETHALEHAQRLNHWTHTAINSASRLYAELLSATGYNKSKGGDYSSIAFGKDTTVEPDVFPMNDTAMEVKRIDSPSQGSVDGHVTKVSEQLDKRSQGMWGSPIKHWVAKIQIDNADNSWPYTPVALTNAVTKGTVNVKKVGLDRVRKYESTTKHIDYIVTSYNANIGNFSVRS